MTDRLAWGRLLTSERLKKPSAAKGTDPEQPWLVVSRIEIERDFDRILFSTPTRRLGDKTQVFPLDRTDSVRNRLTHSHEVANLARSIGTHLMHSPLAARMLADVGADRPMDEQSLKRAVPAVLAAAGLAHDIGNPPFGHQGEASIRAWIRRHEDALFPAVGDESRDPGPGDDPDENTALLADLASMRPEHRTDFVKFEGNAQTIRTLGRLQVVKDDKGLDLTFATLATLMKYTVGSVDAGAKGAPVMAKKHGFFASDADFVAKVRAACGLTGRMRHPLTYIMEACDDIAYLVVDAEDAMKKRVVSFHDLISWLKGWGEPDVLIDVLIAAGEKEAKDARSAQVPPSEVNDVAMQIFRAKAITAMVSCVIRAFEENYDAIMTTGLDQPLLELGPAARLAKALKAFDVEHAYKDRRVLEIELTGHNTINRVMDMLWRGITERESYLELGSARTSPFAQYAYSRISENYRRVFEGRFAIKTRDDAALPVRYRELQLLTDMIAGMTDRYACDLHDDLRAYHVGASKAH